MFLLNLVLDEKKEKTHQRERDKRALMSHPQLPRKECLMPRWEAGTIPTMCCTDRATTSPARSVHDRLSPHSQPRNG